LLAALPQRDSRRFLAGCRPVELAFGEVLATAGERIDHVHFPVAAFASQTTPFNGGTSLNVGLIGDEGMVGIALVIGVDVSPLHTVVRGGGLALRMDAVVFRRQLAGSAALLRLLNRYFYVLMGQLAQTVACTRFHLLEARLARLLLMTQDRAHSNDVHVTHEVFAGMLGMRRAGVTIAATSLQRRELITYRRGDITVLDRDGLKDIACECYATDNALYTRMMGNGTRRRLAAP
jgi:CRP-like cAMP-binding protein